MTTLNCSGDRFNVLLNYADIRQAGLLTVGGDTIGHLLLKGGNSFLGSLGEVGGGQGGERKDLNKVQKIS